MPSQGPFVGTSFSNDNFVGTVAWSNPGNAGASDDVRAVATMPSGTNITQGLKVLGFLFTIPAGATITGIEVRYERSCSDGSNGLDNLLKIVKNGSVVGTAKFNAGAWASTDEVMTLGGPTDLWGTTVTPVEANAADFGVVLSAAGTAAVDLRIDVIDMKVYYNEDFAIKFRHE